MADSVIDGIREFMATCPELEGKKIRVNYLDHNLEYTIDEVPGNPVLRQYTDGSALCRVSFLIASTEVYSRDALENLRSCGVYERIADWLDQQTKRGNLPELPRNLKPTKIGALSNGYTISADAQQASARYQIQCAVDFYKEA